MSMIYINNETTTIKVPKYVNIETEGALFTFTIKNKMNSEVSNVLFMEQEPKELYYLIDISVLTQPQIIDGQTYEPKLIEGEYTYEVTYDDKVLSSGLLIAGDYTAPVTEYQKNSDTIYYEKNS